VKQTVSDRSCQITEYTSDEVSSPGR